MLETIKEMLGRDPFVPFQIVMSSGDRFRIENPALVALGETMLSYYFTRSTAAVHLRPSQISLLQVD